MSAARDWAQKKFAVLGSFMLSDTAACARSWEQTSQENKAYPSYADEDCYVIAGTNGSLSVPTMRLKTYPRPEDRSWWKEFDSGVVDMVRDDPLKHQMNHFADVIEGKAAPLVSVRDGVQNLRVTEAIAEAAKTGLVVSIFQAATQINEMTLSFIPKLVALFATMVLAGPWMLSVMVDYMRQVLEGIPAMVG